MTMRVAGSYHHGMAKGSINNSSDCIMKLHELIRAREIKILEEKLLVAKLNEIADQLDSAIEMSKRITNVKRRIFASETRD